MMNRNASRYNLVQSDSKIDEILSKKWKEKEERKKKRKWKSTCLIFNAVTQFNIIKLNFKIKLYLIDIEFLTIFLFFYGEFLP